MLLKFLFDRVVSFFGLIVLSPVLLIVAILVKVKMPGGPVLFVQQRVGKDARLFKVHKFRTMTVNHGGSSVSVAGESRITPLGAKLRRYKLDELPELWDVLVGNMSFVGPRPDARRARLRRQAGGGGQGRAQAAARHHRSRLPQVPRRGGDDRRIRAAGPGRRRHPPRPGNRRLVQRQHHLPRQSAPQLLLLPPLLLRQRHTDDPRHRTGEEDGVRGGGDMMGGIEIQNSEFKIQRTKIID